MATAARISRWVALACLVVLLGQGLLLVTLTQRSGVGEPHEVPVLVIAPAVVAQELAAEADAMPDRPFVADWDDDVDLALTQVRDGDVVAAVLVDLRGTEDVVVVNARADRELNDAVVDRLRSVEEARDRTARVRELATAGSAGAAATVRRYTLLCGLLGFGFVLAVSLVRGPFAASATRGLVRVVALGAVSIAGAALLRVIPGLALPGDAWAVIGIGAAYAFVAGVITLAVEAMAGLVGLALVSAVYAVLATPLISGVSPYLLPPPWPQVAVWMPAGSAERAIAAVAHFDPSGAVRPVLLLAVLSVAGVAVLLLTRWLGGRPPAIGAEPTEPTEPTRLEAQPMTVRHWRLWILGLVAPVVALTTAAIMLAPAEPVRARPLPTIASETECVGSAGGTEPTLGRLNRVIDTVRDSPAFEGGDVGADVQLQDGRFLLVFGDTIRGEDFDGPHLARNSMMLWGTDCVSVVLPPSKGALIRDRYDGVGYWPMSTAVAHLPGYDLVLVSTQRVEATGGGSFDFQNLGPALAVFAVTPGGTPQLIATRDIGEDSADLSRPAWGAAIDVADDWVYLYGTAHPDDDAFGFSLQVARVRAADVLEESRWRYWDGTTWQSDAARAAELIPAEGGVSQTLSVFHQGKRWYALSKVDGDLGDEMAFWTAPGPTGPFTRTPAVAELPSDPDTGAVTYMPLAHPDVLPKRGSMVVSYSNNNVDFAKVEADPTLYRPTFLRVPLPDAGS